MARLPWHSHSIHLLPLTKGENSLRFPSLQNHPPTKVPPACATHMCHVRLNICREGRNIEVKVVKLPLADSEPMELADQ